MDPRISVFDDDQERIWSGFWQIQYNLQMFGVDTKDFTDRSDDDFVRLVTKIRESIDDPAVEGILDEQIASLASLLGTDVDLSALRKAVVQYIESVPNTLGCFDMNLLYGPYLDETLPAKLSGIAKRHVIHCPLCSKLIIKNATSEL